MAKLTLRQVLGVCALGMALAACDAVGIGGGDNGGSDTATPQPTRSSGVERDVEAPSVFDMQDSGLWDGRPSLGGVWVAHPDVRDPERVIIRNPSTGREVVGALFRRERQNPGPVFQVSADAAAAVGMLAGQPADLSVIALRTQTAPETPEDAVAQAETDADGTTAEAAVAEAPAERRGLGRLFGRSAPATDAATDAASATAAAQGTAGQETASQDTTSQENTDARADVTAETQTPRRRFWPFGRRDDATPEPAQGIETITLDDDVATTPTAQVAPPAAPTPAPETAPSPAPAAAIDRAYVQLGIFSVEENATRAVAQMRALGLQGNVTPGQSGENRYWRVTVGPATSVAQRDQTLATVKEQGFQDAYVVAR